MTRQKSDHIINVSSVAGHRVGENNAVYCATKTAVRVLSEDLRQEVKSYNIRTTTISLGVVQSQLTQSITAADIAAGISDFHEKFAIPVESFARMVAFLIEQPDDVEWQRVTVPPNGAGVVTS